MDECGLPWQQTESVSMNEIKLQNKVSIDRMKDGPVFGFILKHNETGARYLLESQLLRAIRHIWYNNQLTQELMNNPAYNKVKYVILKNAINTHSHFRKLFPELCPELDRMQEHIEVLVYDIYKYISSHVEGSNVSSHESDDVQHICSKLTRIIAKKTIIQNKSVIRDYVVSNNMLQTLYSFV